MDTKQKETFTVGKSTFIQYKKGLIEKDYTIGEVVGSGAFASVRKVKSKTNGQIRALKIIKKQKNQNSARMYLEVEILKKLMAIIRKNIVNDMPKLNKGKKSYDEA